MGLTEKGFIRPTYNDILQEKIQQAKELFGEDIDTSEFSTFGKFIRINTYDLAKAYEDLETTYYARFPNTARGQSLDRLCTFVSISRNSATKAQHEVVVKGTAEYTIASSFKVGTVDGLYFYSLKPVTLDSNGNGTLIVECDTVGINGNVADNKIVNIVNPDMNVFEIVSSKLIEYGKNEESDIELRKRFELAAQGGGSCNTNSIMTNVLRVPEVNSVSVIEDVENHSFVTYVYGGDDCDKEIAQAIFEKAPIGVKTTGDKEVIVTDIGGYEHSIRFSRPTEIEIYIKFKIQTNEDFPVTGEDDIKAVITSYINELGVNKNVIYTSLYSKIYSVIGVTDVTDLYISKGNNTSWTTSNITINEFEVAQSTYSMVTVEKG